MGADGNRDSVGAEGDKDSLGRAVYPEAPALLTTTSGSGTASECINLNHTADFGEDRC